MSMLMPIRITLQQTSRRLLSMEHKESGIAIHCNADGGPSARLQLLEQHQIFSSRSVQVSVCIRDLRSLGFDSDDITAMCGAMCPGKDFNV